MVKAEDEQDPPRINPQLALVVKVDGLSVPRATDLVRWNLIFVWQAPTLMMAYSIVAFLVGLVVYVIAPLYNQATLGGEGKVRDAG